MVFFEMVTIFVLDFGLGVGADSALGSVFGFLLSKGSGLDLYLVYDMGVDFGLSFDSTLV